MPKVLIAEDDPILTRRLERVLERHRDRFELRLVQDGRAAVDLLKRDNADLLITDIQMPEMDGLELLAYVRQHHPVIPCIVMTGYGTPELRRRLPKDLLYFIKKPFDIEKLATLILNVLERDIPQGMIYGISVLSFLTMIQLERKTCLFEVSMPDKPAGLLYFDRGVLFDAVAGTLKGEAAAVSLITAEKAAFRFRPLPAKPLSRRIEKDLEQLISDTFNQHEDLEEIDWEGILEDDPATGAQT